MPSKRCAPATEFIPLAVPEIRGNAWHYVKECLDTNWVSSVGEFVDRFEQALARQTGSKYAVATVNGTAALHIALLVAGVQPNDEVLVSALTFIAPANAVRYVGAWPVFIGPEPDHWQIDAGAVCDFLNRECTWRSGALINRTTGRRVRAVLPVHILGHPVDMDPILEVARKYELPVIEDATESLGARYRQRNVGSLGDIACFSFNGNKLITTGGGGMIVTDNAEWAGRARYLTTQAKDDPIEYVHHEIGYNYRLTNLQAALGCAQLENLEEFIAAKRRHAEIYLEALTDVPGIAPMQEASWAFSSYWLFTVLVDQAAYGEDSRSLLRRLRDNKIEARPLWQPLHRSPAHRGAASYRVDIADQIAGRALSLPSSVRLKDAELETVAEVVRRAPGADD